MLRCKNEENYAWTMYHSWQKGSLKCQEQCPKRKNHLPYGPHVFFSGFLCTRENIEHLINSHRRLHFYANLTSFLDSSGQKPCQSQFSWLKHAPNLKYCSKHTLKDVARATFRAIYAETEKIITSKPLWVEGQNFQDFLVFMVSICSNYFRKIHEVWVSKSWNSGWFDMELPWSIHLLIKSRCKNPLCQLIYSTRAKLK